jgi:hypothetical protein
MSTTYEDTDMLLALIKSWFKPTTYSSELESYITNHNPQNGGDIERLTRQYDSYISQGRIL